jgi:hypothetical protein
MGTYFSEDAVRDILSKGTYVGDHAPPFEGQNSNSGVVGAAIEFYETALALDDGELLDSMHVTDYARAQLARWQWKKTHNYFPEQEK